MKEVNFKIFELPDHQVLLSKDWNNDEGPVLKLEFFVDGMKISQSFMYPDEDKRDLVFEDFTYSACQNFISDVMALFNGGEDE